jgi:hypothetical protein
MVEHFCKFHYSEKRRIFFVIYAIMLLEQIIVEEAS